MKEIIRDVLQSNLDVSNDVELIFITLEFTNSSRPNN